MTVVVRTGRFARPGTAESLVLPVSVEPAGSAAAARHAALDEVLADDDDDDIFAFLARLRAIAREAASPALPPTTSRHARPGAR